MRFASGFAPRVPATVAIIAALGASQSAVDESPTAPTWLSASSAKRHALGRAAKRNA